MPPRVRQRNLTSTLYTYQSGSAPPLLYPSSYYAESMSESSFPGSCNVVHTKVRKTLSASASNGGVVQTWEGFAGYVPPIPIPSKLNWGKLPSSSEFGLIQFFAELDDTLAMFGKRFWRELSYGSFTWGVLPFVSDVKALLQTIKALSTDLSDFSYEDQFEDTVPFDYTDGNRDNWKGTIRAKYRYTGRADMSFQNDASIWLDRLGFHPDLATAWDLVPLSFVLDWVLPVGSFLEGLRGGGWCKVVNFNGWQTCKWTCNGVWKASDLSATSGYQTDGFTRQLVSQPLFIEPTVDVPNLSFPSFREMFNMVYIFGTRR